MVTRAQNNGFGARYLYDDVSGEIIAGLRQVFVREDFLGAGHAVPPAAGSPVAGYPWVTKIVKTAGAPTVAGVGGASIGGLMQLAIDATSEAQEATLYANDSRQFDLSTRQLIFACRLALTVLPGAGVEMVWGLMGSWIAGPDNNAFYARFQANGSGAVNVQTKDGVNTTSTASGVTLTAGQFATFTVDLFDPTLLHFYINGATVGAYPLSPAFAATGANAVLQPYFSVYRGAAGTSLGTMQIDAVQLGSER